MNDLGPPAGLVDQRSQKFVHGNLMPGFLHYLAHGGARGVSPSSSLPLGSTHSLRLRKRTTATSGVSALRSTIPPAARTGARVISRPTATISMTASPPTIAHHIKPCGGKSEVAPARLPNRLAEPFPTRHGPTI